MSDLDIAAKLYEENTFMGRCDITGSFSFQLLKTSNHIHIHIHIVLRGNLWMQG
ncbi:Uncharacterised protein [Escherichia coli]|nr:Uncharacterised protein [Escherichia coli]